MDSVNQFFRTHWGLYKADIERVLNVTDEKGSGSNFSASLLVLTASEQFAKLYAPYVFDKNKQRYRLASVSRDAFKDIGAGHSVELFFRKYLALSNPRYSLLALAKFIWDVFRNSHVHHFYPKKIISVPIDEVEGSFLTGSHWPGKLSDLVGDKGLLRIAREEHLRMAVSERLTRRSGVMRPFFRFIPHIFYLDLLKAATTFEKDVRTIPHRRRLFTVGFTLLTKARRKKFPEDLSQRSAAVMKKEIRKLIMRRND